MKIILHILAKDLRRHWREIALFLLAGIALVWQTTHAYGWLWLRQRELAPFLFIGLWFFIVIRVVQGESLVGDREFWMTRPYRWGHLMAAKALFLVLCLNLPLFIGHIILLAHAGIPLSWSLLPGLLFLQLEFAFFFTFPAVALASITGTLVQWGLSVAGMLVYAFVVSWIPWNKLPTALEGGENVGSFIGMIVIAPALAYVLVWQYARRRPWPARLAFGAALLVIPFVILLASTPLVRSVAYPLTDGKASLQLSIADDTQSGRTYLRSLSSSEPDISLPVTAWPTDPDSIVDVDGLRVTLTGDNGWRWQSPWINHAAKFSKDSPQGSFEFSMPARLADQMAHLHPRASVELAFGVNRLGPPHRIETTSQRFEMPERTFCHWHEAGSDSAMYFIEGEQFFRDLECVAPLRLPEIMEARIDSDTNTCSQADGDPPLPPGHFATDVEQGTDLPADFDPDPVHKMNLNFGLWIPAIPNPRAPKGSLLAQFCRGTPLTIRTGWFVGKMGATFDLGPIGTEKLIKQDSEGTVTFSPAER